MSSGPKSEQDLFATLREIYLSRGTGVLALGDGEERLFFVSGDLYLEPQHPAAEKLSAGVSAEGGGEAAERSAASELVERLLPRRGEGHEFRRGPAGIPSDLLGPLSVAAIVMEEAVRDREEFELLKSLGGERRIFQAAPAAGRSLPDLDPQEAFFLSRLDRAMEVDELVRQSKLEPREALRRLCRLQAAGLIQPVETGSIQAAAGLLDDDILSRFSDRIWDHLEREPLELDPEVHRQRVADLMARVGELTFFDLLGTAAGATGEEIHGAYLKLARLVHPLHAERLGLSGREAGFQVLFERATEAYLTLSDAERSRDYVERIGWRESRSGGGGPAGQVRLEEQEDLAQHNYRVARSMAAREDYHFAIELLNQAIRIAPRAEYYALLGECQEKNPKWLQKAIFSFGKAVELSPEDPDLRIRLGRKHEEAGHLQQARREYEAAQSLIPGHPEAVRGLARLASPGRRAADGTTGSRLLRFLRELISGKLR